MHGSFLKVTVYRTLGEAADSKVDCCRVLLQFSSTITYSSIIATINWYCDYVSMIHRAKFDALNCR